MQRIRGASSRGLLAVATAVLTVACAPVPMLVTPAVKGRVVDATNDQGLPGAIVVVRFDARRGDLLPERDLIGHHEVETDAQGRFRVPRGAQSGIAALVRIEARIVGVMREDYRCAKPRGVKRSGDPLTIQLERASDLEDRQASCRPLAARPSETPAYLSAWKDLYPREGGPSELPGARDLERTLAARALFGHGENCEGPVVDLSLAPNGELAAVRVESADRREVEVVDLSSRPGRQARIPVGADSEGVRRLAWTTSGDLILWEPASAFGQAPSRTLARPASMELVWRGSAPAAADGRGATASRPVPVRPSDLNDEGEARWRGRSFRIARELDVVTGLPVDTLETLSPDGARTRAPLPGETCGPRGQYGRPHFRIAADGRTGLDLRWVEDGCHAIAVDLASGDWRTLDGARSEGVCRARRYVPLPQLRVALRGYVREIEQALEAAGGDPQAAYSLRIAADGSTQVETRDYAGQRIRLETLPFPIETPLRRIAVSAVVRAGREEPTRPTPEPPASTPDSSLSGLEPL